MDFIGESLEMDPVEREMLAKKVKKKLDFILLPMVSAHISWHTISSKLIPVQICFVYLLSFMDKSSLNYANAYGLQADLHLIGRDYCMRLYSSCDIC
jgi:hypothetical protein